MANSSRASKLNNHPIEILAGYQQSQGSSNNCVLHTIATVLNLQFGSQFDGGKLAKQFDAQWMRRPFRYRTFPGWATTPAQAQRIIHTMARQQTFSVRTRLIQPGDAYLQDILRYSKNTYPIITMLWITRPPTLITRQGHGDVRIQAAAKLGGHTMLLAAYDPARVDQAGLPHPWGFINSWSAGNNQDLYWMDQATWHRMIKLKTLLVQWD
jgi:hypothetical protein